MNLGIIRSFILVCDVVDIFENGYFLKFYFLNVWIVRYNVYIVVVSMIMCSLGSLGIVIWIVDDVVKLIMLSLVFILFKS